MPSTILPTLSPDQIDDLLYLARTNDVNDLKAEVESIAHAQNVPTQAILELAVDPDSGNGLLHMAAANGCMAIIEYLLPSFPPTSSSASLYLFHTNASGNTPLHWAALNGHLDAVKHLVQAGVDPLVKNQAGYDAVYEAERNGKEEVVSWLLVEKGNVDGGGSGERGKREEEEGWGMEDGEGKGDMGSDVNENDEEMKT
ncbi:MAG: hypothetical protein Q9219_004348 [cf. Caloplaca sp. 3 TL-2023]